jgi:hypothetical protein
VRPAVEPGTVVPLGQSHLGLGLEEEDLLVQARANLRELSAVADRFAAFAARTPECMERASFRALEECPEFVQYPLQSWPLFVDSSRIAEFGRISRTLTSLVRSIPQRLFGNDPFRLAEVYRLGLQEVSLILAILEDETVLQGTISRGDYIDGAAGLQCLELNMSANLGGWKAGVWADLYLRVPVITRFLAEEGLNVSVVRPLRSLFTHLLAEAKRKGLVDAGELNVVFATQTDAPIPRAWAPHADSELAVVLGSTGEGLSGCISVAEYSDLTERAGRLFLGDRRIHAVIGQSGTITPAVFSCWMAGTVDVYGEFIARILGDKINLALLSEAADKGLFSAEERSVIERHVPWTREMKAGETTWRGERVSLGPFVASERERLVLKRRRSFGGKDVFVGHATPPDEWDEVVATALAESGNFVVQEVVAPKPLLFHDMDSGIGLFDAVWGFFVLGDRFGSGFLRLSPRGEKAVINASQGAEGGVLFEVHEG